MSVRPGRTSVWAQYTVTVDDRDGVQKRMQAWAKLTPQQRRLARETYKQLAKQPPEQRDKLRDKWAEYQRQQPALAPRELPEAPADALESPKEAAQEAEGPAARSIPASPGH